MTLGAVTIGGLVMRAIVKSRHDEDEEKSRVAMECQRLQDEEKERALRVKRKKMESVDGVAVDDDLLMSDFMNRVKSLESDSPQDADDPTDPTHMRHNPIPDRGLGSALLDRPDVDADAADSDDGLDIIEEEQQQLPEPDLANAEQAEMLKRMWNLSSPDKE